MMFSRNETEGILPAILPKGAETVGRDPDEFGLVLRVVDVSPELAKRGLNRSISQQGWSQLRKRIEDKAATCGVEVVAVEPAHTSQRCASCGHTSADNRKSQAVFACVACGHSANADVNAALNILAAGLAVTARGGLGVVEPPVKREPPESMVA